MQVYEKSTFIRCDIEKLFDFHLNTENIKKITPPNIAVELLTPHIIPSEGKILKIKSTKNYIPINWEVKIDKLEKPHKLIDIAVKSPFKYWEHQHLFIQYEEFCELRDIVKFDMPFGILGDLFEPFVYGDLIEMFDYRHKVTKEILERKEDN
jgi:ligand-binding SRPBCC domain-containing protein